MRGLSLDQLRTLVEVVELGSFSAAARQLNLTQPAVSLQMRELEARFGVRLIERMGRKANATPPGRVLVEHARRILSECEAATLAMRRFRDGWIGRVHIGTTLTALTYELPPVLRKLRADHPGVELLVTNMPTRDSIENVLANKIDLALVTLPVKEAQLRVTPLRAETLMAVLPGGTPDVPDAVTPAYAAQQPLVLEHTRGAVCALVMQWLGKELPLARAPMHIGTVEAMKAAVASGLGMSIVPDVAVLPSTPDLIVRPLDPPLPCTLALIEHRSKPNEPALEIVRNALMELRCGKVASAGERGGAAREPRNGTRSPEPSIAFDTADQVPTPVPAGL
jgi:DNA-binding transcriptional LysR family regulator